MPLAPTGLLSRPSIWRRRSWLTTDDTTISRASASERPAARMTARRRCKAVEEGAGVMLWAGEGVIVYEGHKCKGAQEGAGMTP